MDINSCYTNKSIYFASYYQSPSDHLQSLETLDESLTKLYRTLFNISKCVHLQITNKAKPRLHSYAVFGVPLSTISCHPYLRVKLYTKLTWANHITDIVSKSSKVLGMIKRTLGLCKPHVKETVYNMLVRPKLEYASTIWNQQTTTRITHLENVQPDLSKKRQSTPNTINTFNSQPWMAQSRATRD